MSKSDEGVSKKTFYIIWCKGLCIRRIQKVNKKFFCFNYSITHFCTWICKYANKLFETLVIQPFIDVPSIAYEDKRINSIDDLFKAYIYIWI